jgi:mRNA interferase RelE/StbE
MTYELAFKTQAKKEWDKLASPVKAQFKKKLIERLENPHVESAKLSGIQNCYKIKLRAVGYRLVYQVKDEVVLVTVVAIGKRERNAVYKSAIKRIE